MTQRKSQKEKQTKLEKGVALSGLALGTKRCWLRKYRVQLLLGGGKQCAKNEPINPHISYARELSNPEDYAKDVFYKDIKIIELRLHYIV